LSHDTILEHAVRDAQADAWFFSGHESYLSNVQLPENFSSLPFQQHKSIRTRSGDTCKVDEFVSLTESDTAIELVSDTETYIYHDILMSKLGQYPAS
jgi:hypothetical protein